MKKSLFGRRVQVISSQTEDMHNEISTLYENLIDGEYRGSLDSVERIRIMLNLIKNQIIEGDIIKI